MQKHFGSIFSSPEDAARVPKRLRDSITPETIGRVLSFILLLLCIGISPSCSPADRTDSDSTADSLTIPTVVKLIGVQWFNRMEVGIQRFSDETGHHTFMLGPPRSDAALQVQILEDLIAQNVDAITVVPFSPESLEPVLQRAMDEGIVVITHEASNQQSFDLDLEAFDNAAYGAHLMDGLAECMGEEGEYAVFVGSLTSRTHNEWVDAAIARQKEAYPQMSMVGSKNESYDNQQNAYAKTGELVRTYPKLKGFLGSASTDVAGVGLAVEEKGLEDRTCVFGTSLPSVSGQYLNTGAVDRISFWDPADAGYAMDILALKVIRGEKVETGDSLGVDGYEDVVVRDSVVYGQAWVDVTRENMSQYDF
ncbi:MAG: autoinducer 2 ABC transporter substrate-binding protein [Acidobacteriota bacterium]|nr:MAG: autoinducer 2 ABC transporter substrate-binding protein [Acidobacteriota bacterium]